MEPSVKSSLGAGQGKVACVGLLHFAEQYNNAKSSGLSGLGVGADAVTSISAQKATICICA